MQEDHGAAYEHHKRKDQQNRFHCRIVVLKVHDSGCKASDREEHADELGKEIKTARRPDEQNNAEEQRTCRKNHSIQREALHKTTP